MKCVFSINKLEIVEREESFVEDSDSQESNNNTSTIRTIESAELVVTNDFDCGGNFTQEELIKNDGKVFIIYAEKTNSDSFATYRNESVEFIEAFLTKEKAENCKKALLLQSRAMLSLSFERNKDKVDQINENLIENLKELGIEKIINNKKKYGETKTAFYISEDGVQKDIYIEWAGFGVSLSDLEIFETVALNFDKVFTVEEDKQSKKRKKLT